ncbi:MAG: hypothetical protein D3X82_16735 [Candidatus Leucobacter sulfamidivorax]|nr:hypothetical protein [Candidatus Leucobacter sulfamidivorax]
MGWKVNFGGVELRTPITDQMHKEMREHFAMAAKTGGCAVITLGDAAHEGVEQLHWTPGVAVVFTRLEASVEEFAASLIAEGIEFD